MSITRTTLLALATALVVVSPAAVGTTATITMFAGHKTIGEDYVLQLTVRVK